MHIDSIEFTLFLIFTGASILATLALYARQSLLVAYIVVGILLGPSGIELVTDAELIKDIAHVGIIFLLFLLGLNLPISKFLHLVKQTTLITAASSTFFMAIGYTIAWIFGYAYLESLVIGASLMFSSTIIGLKLLPTTVLHHRQTGEIIISVLLLQDIIAIILLLILQAGDQASLPIINLLLLAAALVAVFLLAFFAHKYLLTRLMSRFDKIHEYVFLLTIGWCLAIAQLASSLGLSYEIGAFTAGVALASNPISLYIAEVLKPLRDFFLIMFFFSLGATFDLSMVNDVLLHSFVLALLVLSLKPIIFKVLLDKVLNAKENSLEIGIRLGQTSEFSILIAVMANDMSIIEQNAAYLIHVSTLITFILSSYLIIFKYPTPVAVSDKLRRD